ncbi:MAG: pentachlorophenol monooxygenase, partial [Streptomyces sp.]|nr:pentachlorophenol monooxygenase [Streptomyces sp.]
DASARRDIDSGKLAEPYVYAGSPLTTPADGTLAAGVICPDAPVAADGRRTRLRRLFGSGFTVLTARSDRVAAARAACGDELPCAVYALPGIDVDGVLAPALRAAEDTVWLVRPDGHLAAVLPEFSPSALRAALIRAVGRPA